MTGAAVLDRPRQRQVTTALAVIHARRYLRHPLFLVSVVLLLGGLVQAYLEPGSEGSGWDSELTYALWLGLPGLMVGYRLTVTEQRALSLLPSAPADARTRTMALYLACLVPVAACLAFMGAMAVVNYLQPAGADAAFVPGPANSSLSWVEYVAMVLDYTVVSCFGGPALGVTVARWVRFPGAGLLATVLLLLVEIVACGAGEGVPGSGDAWWSRAFNNLMPYVYWKAGGENRVYDTVREGSPVGHLVFALALCGLAVAAGVLKGAEPDVRRRWMRAVGVLVMVAMTGYLWALFG